MRAMRTGHQLTLRRSVLRTFLLTVSVVVGVVIGLLGMHVLSTGQTHHAPVTTVHDAQLHDAGLHEAEAMVSAFDGSAACAEGRCQGEMDGMSTMACVLALFVAALVTAIRPTRGFLLLARTLTVPPGIRPPVVAPSRPPDLTVFSISRT
ncbi:hypothetical protein GCM10022219_06760 [Microbacterium oryzae]|uniref:Uncharacterized protein n=1 Tax=Microbacterium oryzae TaxID=743009 RepID=A0A6I6DRT0_9MICO|nr:DUF6153 family protein [Microbacterium oryzae]QGU26776.1 hypothetical protein D7D94_03160 [Microbacterium oryzae]